MINSQRFRTMRPSSPTTARNRRADSLAQDVCSRVRRAAVDGAAVVALVFALATCATQDDTATGLSATLQSDVAIKWLEMSEDSSYESPVVAMMPVVFSNAGELTMVVRAARLRTTCGRSTVYWEGRLEAETSEGIVQTAALFAVPRRGAVERTLLFYPAFSLEAEPFPLPPCTYDGALEILQGASEQWSALTYFTLDIDEWPESEGNGIWYDYELDVVMRSDVIWD